MRAQSKKEVPQKTIQVPVNNEILYDQISKLLINEYYDRQLSKSQSGSIEFFVRDGKVAINFYEKTASLIRGRVKSAEVGMSKNGLKYFLLLLEDSFEELKPVDYGYLFISYSVDEAGNLLEGQILLKEEIHYNRTN